ncbi:MAG TPA: hypothetical protein VGM25_17295 [Caulobacteraceae bacterium]|jgi:hypothetical protein
MAERRVHFAAAAVLALGLVAVVVLGHPAAWRAWLGAACLAIAVPAGAVGWCLAMRLCVGEWTGPVAEASAAIAGRMPYAAVLFVPILLRPSALYPWVGAPPAGAFRAVYLSVAFFDARAIAWLVALSLAGLHIAAGRPVSKAAACLGLIAFFLFGMLNTTDWLGSLDLTFNSSGFGLYVACLQFASALALAILAGEPEETHRAGALLLALMLMWAYFAFMVYFIPWSGNLRGALHYYRARQVGIWPWLMTAIGCCRMPILFALFFRTVRHGRTWMQALAGLVLVGSVMEFAWMAMPDSHAGPMEGVLYTVLALAGVAACWPPRAAIPDAGGAA